MNVPRIALRLAMAVVAAAGVALLLWRSDDSRGNGPPADSIVVTGGDGASIPVSTPAEQGLDAASLESARATADTLGARALLIARRGHRVYEWRRDEGLVRSPLLSRLVVEAVGSSESPQITELWSLLSASDARVERAADGSLAFACCLWLQPRDALALATALLQGGTVGGTNVVPEERARHALEQLEDGVAPRGDEPFGARPARLLRDAAGSRLYLFPAQALVILLVGAEESRLADETALAHQVLRAIVDVNSGPGVLVPGH
ncbi:MAG: hypothetical protein ABW136_03230 [Steroidobacteraceae bacterium]